MNLRLILAAALLVLAPALASAQVATQNALTSGGVIGQCAIYTTPVTIGPTACGSGGGGSVNTVFGRSGPNITAQNGDYNIGQITGPGTWTNGQLPIGSTTTGTLVPGTLTGGTNVTISTSPGGITINSTASGSGCIPSGSAGNVLIDSGSGTCPPNNGLTFSGGNLTVGVVGVSQGSVKIAGSTSGTAVITTPAANGSPILTLGSASGTPAVTASSPLSITTATGNMTCATCTTNAAAATSNNLMIGGGGQAIAALGTLGTANTVLHGGTGAPTFGSVNLATDVTGLLAGSNCATPTTTTTGCIESVAAVSHEWIASISNAGVPNLTQPTFSDILGTISSAQCVAATTGALGCVKPDGSSITISAGVISAPGSGGGTVDSGTQSQVAIYFGAGTTTAVEGYSFGNTFVVDNTNKAVYSINPDNDQSANYAFTASDMGGVVSLTGTHTLTFPAVTAGPPPIWANGQSSCYTNVGVGNWTISTTPTINGLKSTTIYPSGNGCVVSNGTSLDWMGVAGDEARLNAANTWGALQTFPIADIAVSGSTAHGVLIGENASAISSTAAGTSAQLLLGQTSADPTWNTMSGDATISSSGALTIANNAVTNAKAAQGGANTYKGNPTGSIANEQDVSIPSCSTASCVYQYTSGTGPTARDLATMLPRFFSGCGFSNDATTPNTILDIAACTTASSDNTTMMNAAAFTKTTGSWTVGSGNGCLDAGTVGNSFWYHVWEIERTDTAVVDYLCSLAGGQSAVITVTIASPAVVTWANSNMQVGTPVVFTTTGALPTGITAGTTYYVISAGLGASAFEIATSPGGSAINTTGSQSGTHTGTALPALPANYTKERWVATFATDASAHILPMICTGNHCSLNPQIVTTTTAGTSASLNLLAGLPIGKKVIVDCRWTISNTANSVILTSPDEDADVAPGTATPFTTAPGWDQLDTTLTAGDQNANCPFLISNAGAQIRERASAASTTSNFVVKGFFF